MVRKLIFYFTCVFLGFSSQGHTFTCQDLLSVRAFTPRFIKERFQNTFVKAAAKDPRLAILKLIEVSTKVDLIDNMTSPALLTTVVFRPEVDSKVFKYLKESAAETTVSKAVAVQHALPKHVRVLFEMLERKYRLALEILNLAYREKTGEELQIGPEEFAFGFVEYLRDTVAEISLNAKSRGFFSGVDLKTIDWVEVQRIIAEPLKNSPLFAFSSEEKLFHPEFLEVINPANGYRQMLHETTASLRNSLETVPVGVSYRILDLVSSVRFGNRHFYNNYRSAPTTSREAYVKDGEKAGGIVEAELDVPASKKKLIATLLDRSHLALDPIGGLSKRKGVCFYTCGSFPPGFFLRIGKPLVSVTYGTPSPLFVSLAIQKLLGIGPVKAMGLRDFTWKKAKYDIPVILLHDVLPAWVEIQIYMMAWAGLQEAISSLF
jgi:hypothetical protein